MATFQKLGDYSGGTTVDGTELTNEFNNIYNAFNGTSTDKEIHHKFSGTNPSLILNQQGSGLILDARKSGVTLLSITNSGKITSPSIIVRELTFYIVLPSALTSGEVLKLYGLPLGSINITNLKISYNGGSHTSGGVLTYRITKNNVQVGTALSLDNTNNTIRTLYTQIQAISVTVNDIIGIARTALTGSVTETNITVTIQFEQKLN